uniref:Uncharacterized protein n=1 Tax=Tanacetum cinerariifolium TaxID=118510 RepID=A0A699X7C4_TANCI|nr:hypothetical protein [Tanacetum cinerariifolium]
MTIHSDGVMYNDDGDDKKTRYTIEKVQIAGGCYLHNSILSVAIARFDCIRIERCRVRDEVVGYVARRSLNGFSGG